MPLDEPLPPAASPVAHPAESPARPWLAGLGLAAAALLAYHGTFGVPLLFDDRLSIADNPSIRHLWPPGPLLAPPPEVFTAGRPLLNLSFALNYAWSGTAPASYHAVNLAVHLLAALTLYGVMRRALRLPRWRGRHDAAAPQLALAASLLWLLHPLATNAVTYLSQRAESLMALCALGTLYSFLRSATSTRPGGWHAAVVASCALGMATKEVMVVVPLLVLLADQAFVAGSWRGAWHARRGLYLGLGATWLLLAFLMATSGLGARSVGFAGSYGPWSYLLTECPIVARYLGLALWPQPLVFDYGLEWPAPHLPALLLPGLTLLTLVVLVVRGLLHRSAAGYLGAWFFLLLAPTSTIIPVQAQPMAESRLYLPLAAAAAGSVLGLHALLGRRVWGLLAALALSLAALTVARNRTYGSEAALWRDTVAKRPGSSRAHNTYAALLLEQPDQLPAAIAHAEAALKIKPDFAHAHYNLATALSRRPDRTADAIAHFEAALQLQPAYFEAHHNLAVLLARDPARQPAAIAHYTAALRLKPDFAEAHNNLAGLLSADPSRHPDAIRHYEAALRADPNSAAAHYNLANLLAESPGRAAERIGHYEQAIRLQPGLANAYVNLGGILAEIPGRESEAVARFEAAVRLAPEHVAAHFNLATTLLRLPGRQTDAIRHYQIVLQLRPDLDAARQMLRQLGADAR